MARFLWNHWFWVTRHSCFLVLLCAAFVNAESLRVELLSGEGKVAENDPELKANESGYMAVSQHREANRDIGGEQLGSQVLPLVDKLARVNSTGVEPMPTTRKLADPAQQPTRAGKSLSQRPVTIQVKPQDISIIFRRTGTLTPSSDRKPQISQEDLSRIFKLDIYDSQKLEVVSEARKADIEPEVSDNVASDMNIKHAKDETNRMISNVSDPAFEQFPVQSDANKLFVNKKDRPLRSEKQRQEVVTEKTEPEVKVRKPEGRSLNINTTEYKYYMKDAEVIQTEVVEINDTMANLIHKAVVINRPLYDHNPRVGQLSSSESHGSSMKKTMVRISQSNLIGIGLGVLLFLLTLAVLIALVFQKTDYLKKADSMENNFVNPYSQSESPAWMAQTSSVGRWPAVQDSKSGSQEDLHSLDNDSFLNSLEAITTCEYWPERSWNS